jgi:mono/diheme cytochrome c family protein
MVTGVTDFFSARKDGNEGRCVMHTRRTFAYDSLVLVIFLATVTAAQQLSPKRVPVRYTSPAAAQEMYTSYCAACHGKTGKGDGPAARALRVSPPDLTKLAKQNNGKYPSSHVAAILEGKVQLTAHGSQEMPVWRPIFMRLGQGHAAEVQQRATNLAKYIESLQVK